MPLFSTLLLLLILLILFSAFFSSAEAALISINKVRLRHQMESKKKGATRLYGLIQRMDKLIATILVGNNLLNTATASIATILISQWLGPSRGMFVATILITVILVIFADLIPKIIATGHPERVAYFSRHVISFFITVFGPLTNFLTWVANGFIKLFGGNPHFRQPLVTEEEMRMMIQIGKEEGIYGDSERKMLERIFRFDDTEVRDVMTPIEKVTAVPIGVEPEELERVLLEEGHNRIPVYEGAKENIVGILYVRDLLYLMRDSSLIRLEDLISAPFFVPPGKKVAELLRDFQTRKIQIAIVRDPKTEKAVGLVTLEDLMEEIVGEIEEVEPRPEGLVK